MTQKSEEPMEREREREMRQWKALFVINFCLTDKGRSEHKYKKEMRGGYFVKW